MKKHPNPELIDDENPEWTDESFARARHASEVLPELFGAQVAKTMLKPRGKQVAPTKRAVTVRYSPDVLDAFKATGAGWQTRMDAALKDWLRTHSPVSR
jgi:uncharacterized protein (DUF4415 family)